MKYIVATIGLILTLLMTYLIVNNHKKSQVAPQFQNLSTDPDHPDTILGYWNGGSLILVFKTHEPQDTVAEENQ